MENIIPITLHITYFATNSSNLNHQFTQTNTSTFLVVITTCNLLHILIALDKSLKILIAKDSMWHQATMAIV
jgi:hypothetical protein